VNLSAAFQSHIKDNHLFPGNARLFIAVSGGVDSVVLCHLCAGAGYQFTLLHCNFTLRGKDSDNDALFVQQLAEALNMPVKTISFDTAAYAAEHKLSIQVAARNLRYDWFKQVMGEEITTGSSYLLTAHHKDDDVETMLMNFFKGTGMAGLKGIPQQQDRVVRPLLFAPKTALLAYARENNLTWVEDSSNAETKYTRNYFRNFLLPLVNEKYPAAEENLYNNIQRFKEAELLYQQAIAVHKKKLLQVKGAEVHIPVLRLKSVQPLVTIVYEIAKPYHFTAAQTGDIIALLDAATGKYVQSATHRILRNRSWLIISPLQTEEAVHVVVDGEGEYAFGTRLLRISKQEKAVDIRTVDKNTAYINGELLQYPLVLRKWKTGDYFYPLGMRKKKKLARFFIDQKIAAGDKEKVWVLEMNKQVVWVVGHRIDDRFKVPDRPVSLVQLQLV
jgi:tRNA(Ile)-lysidine synthase